MLTSRVEYQCAIAFDDAGNGCPSSTTWTNAHVCRRTSKERCDTSMDGTLVAWRHHKKLPPLQLYV